MLWQGTTGVVLDLSAEAVHLSLEGGAVLQLQDVTLRGRLGSGALAAGGVRLSGSARLNALRVVFQDLGRHAVVLTRSTSQLDCT